MIAMMMVIHDGHIVQKKKIMPVDGKILVLPDLPFFSVENMSSFGFMFLTGDVRQKY